MAAANNVWGSLIPLLISLIMGGVCAVGAQTTTDEGFKTSVDVDLVTADVAIMGQPPPDLNAEDFAIYDNNIAHKTSYFSHDELPLALALVFDTSGSITQYLPWLQNIALSALQLLKTEDQVALFSFANGVSRVNDLTEDRLLIAEKIGKFKTKDGTNIYDSIYDAAQYLKKAAPHRRRAIILLSDNIQTFPPKHGADSCRVELLETFSVLFNIRIGNTFNSESNSKIMGLVEETGGEVLNVDGSMTLKDAMEMAITKIRMQYTVGFNPSEPGARGSFHKLAVRFADEHRCPDCRIAARSGYYAGIAPPLPIPEKVRINPSHSSQEINQLLIRQSIVTAGTVKEDSHDISFLVSTAEQTDPDGNPQVKVNLQIYLDGVGFKNIEDKHTCNLRVYIFYADEKGKILGSDSRKVDGFFSEESYIRVMRAGIPFSAAIPLKAKNQILRIVVYDEGRDKIGSRLIKLQNGQYRN